jgi:hypothetical protein
MGDLTPNYSLYKPLPSESMADVKRNVNDNFKAMSALTKHTNVATLPTFAEGAIVGQTVYLTDANYQSVFICVVSDAIFGAMWRPVQAPKSPFFVIPSTAFFVPANWRQGTLKVTFDNQGQVWFKGWFEWIGAGTFPAGTTLSILRNFPKGLRPSFTKSLFMLVTDPQPESQPPLDYNGGWFAVFGATANFPGVNAVYYFRSDPGSAQFMYMDSVFYPVGEGFVTA